MFLVGFPSQTLTGQRRAERGAPPPPSAVKARFATGDRKQAVTVVVREAAALKPTFQQVLLADRC